MFRSRSLFKLNGRISYLYSVLIRADGKTVRLISEFIYFCCVFEVEQWIDSEIKLVTI